MKRLLAPAIAALAILAAPAGAQPLRLEITEGVTEPLPFALPRFAAENAAAERHAEDISRVIAADLANTGLFREIPREAHISGVARLDDPVRYADWKAINAQALIVGAVGAGSGGRLVVKFRLFDVFSEAQLGDGLQFGGSRDNWRRMAHKVADEVHLRITGEPGYFDSRVAFVSETGPKDARNKRIAIMDYDGADPSFLTDGRAIALAPRYSPAGDLLLYTSYETGEPRVFILDIANGASRPLGREPDAMTFAPRFSPDGSAVAYSLARSGNTDIYVSDLRDGAPARLTASPSIETSPSYSPDGRRIAFESDRSGSQQIYVMSANGDDSGRISFGPGRYSAPVWSPRGDLIAFVKQHAGRFHIGVMRPDGSDERLLTASFLDESPSWAPNGRAIIFAREPQGAGGLPELYTVDLSGRNLRRVPTRDGASDPSWGPPRP